jgi:hypothetical protein
MIIDRYSVLSVLSAQLLLGSYGSNYPIKRLPKKKSMCGYVCEMTVRQQERQCIISEGAKQIMKMKVGYVGILGCWGTVLQ